MRRQSLKTIFDVLGDGATTRRSYYTALPTDELKRLAGNYSGKSEKSVIPKGIFENR